MSRLYKNTLPLRDKAFGKERRQNLTKEELKDSTPLPSPLTYEDVDKTFKDWVDKEIEIVFDGKRVPTYALFSNQRFSEYLQSWEHVDENKNPILNFKTVTRESNPQSGSINGESKNIPGERTFLMQRVEARDKNNRKYFIDYRMKQPIGVDFRYTISFMTNKYELLNTFNTKIQDLFKSITGYIRVREHYISMTLDSISDESQYNIDDRQFYSQSCVVLVRAYIITEDSLEVVEVPDLRLMGFDAVEKDNTFVDIDEDDDKNSCITMSFGKDVEKTRFYLDSDFMVEKFETLNVKSFVLKVNDDVVSVNTLKDVILKNETEIKVNKLRKNNEDRVSTIKIYGKEV